MTKDYKHLQKIWETKTYVNICKLTQWAISSKCSIRKVFTGSGQHPSTAVSPARVVWHLQHLWCIAAQLLQEPLDRLAGVHTLLQGTCEVVDLRNDSFPDESIPTRNAFWDLFHSSTLEEMIYVHICSSSEAEPALICKFMISGFQVHFLAPRLDTGSDLFDFQWFRDSLKSLGCSDKESRQTIYNMTNMFTLNIKLYTSI
jgi:hypothetical protein